MPRAVVQVAPEFGARQDPWEWTKCEKEGGTKARRGPFPNRQSRGPFPNRQSRGPFPNRQSRGPFPNRQSRGGHSPKPYFSPAPPPPPGCGMRTLSAVLCRTGAGLQSNNVRTKRSSAALPYRRGGVGEIGLGIIWNGQTPCGENLGRILQYHGKIWYNISRSWHKNTRAHQTLTGKLCTGD